MKSEEGSAASGAKSSSKLALHEALTVSELFLRPHSIFLNMTYLPSPQPVVNSDILIHGDVEIHPTASLAPGVILQAAPDHKIFIGANVCVGMGVILNAGWGSITVENGVTLGSGVLIIGESKIGNNACIGTATTIFQTSIAPMTVINPGSIVGDISRQVVTRDSKTETQKSNKSASNNKSNSTSFNNNRVETNGSKSANDNSNVKSDSSVNLETGQNKDAVERQQGSVVGQAYINQLLVTLFPHKKAVDFNSKNTTPDSQ
jgi:carbon dioxide concentrating mechanism protein CcmN